VNDHLKDADVQQFINSRTNHPVSFLVEVVTIEEREIDVVRIAKDQPRPVYAKAAYGDVKAHVVYFRRGSSTAEALPEEIFAMGRAQAHADASLPVMELGFADAELRTQYGLEIEVTSQLLVDALSSRHWEEQWRMSGVSEILRAARPIQPQASPEAIREYCRASWILTPVGLWIKNSGSVTALDVSLEMTIERREG
jgi:hypothetical protein